MGGVASFVGDVVGGAADVVGDVVGGVGDIAGDAVEFVADSVSDTVDSVTTITEAFLDDPIEFAEAVVDSALKNPIETAAVVAAGYYAPQLVAELAPGLSATATNIAADVGVGATKALLEGESVGESIIGDLIGAGITSGFTEAKDLIKESISNLPSIDLVDELADTGRLDSLPLDVEELAGVIGDQAGDFPLEGSFGNVLAPGVKEAVQELLDANVITNQQAQEIIEDAISETPAETPIEQPTGIETLPKEPVIETPIEEAIGDQPGDFPLEGSFGEPLAPEVKEAVQELLDSGVITQEQAQEIVSEAVAETPVEAPTVVEEPSGIETLPPEVPAEVIGDQEGDFPLEGSFGEPLAPEVKEAVQELLDSNAITVDQAEEILQRPIEEVISEPIPEADIETSPLPEETVSEVIGDQEGDFPLEGSFGEPLAPEVREAVQELLDSNAITAEQVEEVFQRPIEEVVAEPIPEPELEVSQIPEETPVSVEEIIGDQEGDFPLEGGYGEPLAPEVKEAVQDLLDSGVITPEQVEEIISESQPPAPVEDIIGDQEGDFPLEGGYGEPLAPEVKEAVQDLLNSGAITPEQIEEVFQVPAEEVVTIGDQPGDFPLEGSFGQPTAPGVQEAVQDLLDYNAGIATQLPEVIGDQPGDYPLNQEELDLAAQELEDIPFGSLGDQPGDYPLTEQDLALEDELMGQIGDQPGDYPTEGGYGDPLAPGVKDAVQDLLDYNAGIAGGAGSSGQGSGGGGGSGGVQQNAGFGVNPLLLAALLGTALGTSSQPRGQRVGFSGPIPEYLATRIPGMGVQYTPVQQPVNAAEGGLMSIYPPGESVLKMAAGGIAAMANTANKYRGAPDTALEDMFKAGRGSTVDEANALSYLIGRGYSPKEAESIVQQGVNVYSFARGGSAQMGGGISDLGSYTHAKGGRMLKGPGDGMSDSIPATIEGKRPARLATDEFVVPADVVSHLGNGSSDAGAKVLYDMMDRVRKARTGTSKQGKQINPKKFLPK